MRCFLLLVLCLWQVISTFQAEIVQRTRNSQSNHPSSRNSVPRMHQFPLLPLYMESVRVQSTPSSRLWTKAAATKEACADKCTHDSARECQLVQFNKRRQLCTGFGYNVEAKFVYDSNYFTYTNFAGSVKRYPDMSSTATDLTYGGVELSTWLQINWTEQHCTNVCQLHPKCGAAIFNTNTKECALKDRSYVFDRVTQVGSIVVELRDTLGWRCGVEAKHYPVSSV